ncbi:MAG: hypothetical protein LAQ69_37460, partial [Acidobacteriia bacterium]|nr:hypothetical protein [Terriglobia bacterium]
MFEQSTLPSGPASKRLWATCVGLTGEALLVGCAILAPMVWPQVLPRTTLITSLLPPVPSPPPKTAVVRPRPTQVTTHRMPVIQNGLIYRPTSYPTHAQIIEDPPAEVSGDFVIGAVPTGETGGVPNGIF